MGADTKGRMLGVVLLGILVSVAVKNTASGLVYSYASERWPRTTAQVVDSEVYHDGTAVPPRWEPAVVYQYKVSDQTFTSGRVRFLMPPIYRREEATHIAESYKVGRVVRVAYDPADPRESVLEPGPPSGTLKEILIVLFLISLTGYIYYEIHHPERRILLRTKSSSR